MKTPILSLRRVGGARCLSPISPRRDPKSLRVVSEVGVKNRNCFVVHMCICIFYIKIYIW